MTYTAYEPEPEPNSDAYDDVDDYRDAVDRYERARDRIFDAVERCVEVVQDNEARYKIRAVVPFRVTAYRHDYDDHRVDKLQEDFGRTPPGEPTDGFVTIDRPPGMSNTFRSVPFTHNQEWAIGFGTDDHSNAKRLARDALKKTVYAHVADGRVSVPITATVLEERFVDDDGTVGAPYPAGGPLERDTEPLNVETVEREFRVGEATYKVDAVVDPVEWEGADE